MLFRDKIPDMPAWVDFRAKHHLFKLGILEVQTKKYDNQEEKRNGV